MIVFVDTSILLRRLFGEAGALDEWARIEAAYASRLLRLELGRVIDRARLAGRMNDEAVAELHQEARRTLRSIELLAVTEEILDRAAGPMPTAIGSLDAVHLVTALELERALGSPVVFATHDLQLARAARASGLDVVGVQ